MFQKIEKTIGVSNFRADMPAHLRRAKQEPLVITTRRGDEPYVVMSADTYNKLVEMREDALDARLLATLVREDKNKKKIAWKRG